MIEHQELYIPNILRLGWIEHQFSRQINS